MLPTMRYKGVYHVVEKCSKISQLFPSQYSCSTRSTTATRPHNIHGIYRYFFCIYLVLDKNTILIKLTN